MYNLKAVWEPLNELSIPMFSDSLLLPKELYGIGNTGEYGSWYIYHSPSWYISIFWPICLLLFASQSPQDNWDHMIPGPQGPLCQLMGLLHMEWQNGLKLTFGAL